MKYALKGDVALESWLLPKELLDYGTANFEKIYQEHPPDKFVVKMLGKDVVSSRYAQSYNIDYSFAGITASSVGLPEVIQPFMDYAKGINPALNGVFVNWYYDGTSYIGPHRDRIDKLLPEVPILSITLGADRIFRLREYPSKAIAGSFNCGHGTVIMMSRKLNDLYTHEIVKINGKKGQGVGRRINMTFRAFKSE